MPLYGTAPSSIAHLVLAAARPPSTWPARFKSPLHKALSSTFPSLSIAISDASHPLTIHTTTNINKDDESYGAFLYTPNNDGGSIHSLPFPVSLSTIGTLQKYVYSISTTPNNNDNDKIIANHIYVCTHGSRDCRCGDLGEPVYKAIKTELTQRRLISSAASSSSSNDTYSIHRTSHIGGHKWAANVLHYPSSNWYGLVTPQLVPKLVDHWVGNKVLWSNWRGRLGLYSEEQNNIYSLNVDRSSNLTPATSPSHSIKPLGDDPIEIPFQRQYSTNENEIIKVRAYPNESLMTAAKRSNLVEATCAGQCECATCHVYLPDYSSSSISPPTDEELDQLDYAIDRKPTSRLACQISIDDNFKKWINQGHIVGLPRF